MNKKGFTLSELLIVLAIIAIITLITIPSIWLVNRNSANRLFNSRKEFAVSAAEFYAQDNDDIFRNNLYNCGTGVTGERDFACVKIQELINKSYIESDLKHGEGGCTSHTGCLTNPIDKSILNNHEILVRKEGNVVIAEWDGSVSINDDDELVDIVCSRLADGTYKGKYGTGETDTCDCTYLNAQPDGTACLITGDVINNYLSYSGYMWRIMGVYVVNGNKVVKMVTDDNLITP